jgi:hypothetical protein
VEGCRELPLSTHSGADLYMCARERMGWRRNHLKGANERASGIHTGPGTVTSPPARMVNLVTHRTLGRVYSFHENMQSYSYSNKA